MNSKDPPGPAEGERTAGADDESIDGSLNQILADSEPGTGNGSTRPGGEEEVTAEADADVDLGSPSDVEPPIIETIEGETIEAETIEADTGSIPEKEAPSGDAGAVSLSPEAVASSMSGPALVDDNKEEHTDVESPEAMAAAAAAAEKIAEGVDAGSELLGTPVREELTANLARSTARQEEATTAPGSGNRTDEVITAENLGLLAQTKEATRAGDQSGSLKLPAPSAAASEPSLAEQSREERDRVLRRSRPPTPVTPLPRLRDRARGSDGDELLDQELEVAALDYERHRPAADDDGGGRRATDSSPVRTTSSLYPGPGSGSGRHPLPPPAARKTPTSGRARLPTPKPSSLTPSPRVSSTGIPIVTVPGASGPVRTPSAVFNKVQLPLGGLVTVVGAAFGVGLIIGAVLWRGGAEPAPDSSWHPAPEAKAAPAPTPAAGSDQPAATPAPMPASSAPPPAAAAEATAAPATPPAPAVPAAAIAPAVPPPAAERTTPSPPPAPVVIGAKDSNKKVASSSAKTTRTKKSASATTTGKSDGPAKSKGGTWVDPFAQ
ncbi:MAG TPA: hypothetical protein VH374_05490 [Polyangia bacterium]|jgi:hypothetical protein|nr:hypothetical protein [Polyangia bacterium]